VMMKAEPTTTHPNLLSPLCLMPSPGYTPTVLYPHPYPSTH